jgi:hypothetical protein
MTIIDALRDPHLFGRAFRDLRTWAAWIVVLKALFGLPMEAAEVEVYRRLTGRENPPTKQAREGWFVIGRRGGKSRIAAVVAVFLSAFRDYKGVLAPGERGTLMVIAADRRQARVVFRYIVKLLENIPMLAGLIEKKNAESIDLSNGITIEIHTANFRGVRGYSIVGAVLDEIAFWPTDDSANPDKETVAALRPAMATVPGALLLGISSPYSRRGMLWEMHRSCFGVEDSEVLVVQAPTQAMNPAIPEDVIARAYADDEAVASAEYGAEFRRDLEAFISREVVDSCIVPGRHELPPRGLQYVAFCDPSGGSGGDSFTLAIAHAEGEKRVLDLIRERRPPLSPDQVIGEFSETLKQYGLSTVTGDKYSAMFVVEAFERHGIRYESSAGSKSEIYLEALPLLNSGQLELLDDERMVSQLIRLERRTGRGRDGIDHAPGQHDDVANAVCGVLMLAQVDLGPFLPGDVEDYLVDVGHVGIDLLLRTIPGDPGTMM